MLKCKNCKSNEITKKIKFGSFPNSRGFSKEPVINPYSHQIDLIMCKDCELIYMGMNQTLQLYRSIYSSFQKATHRRFNRHHSLLEKKAWL